VAYDSTPFHSDARADDVPIVTKLDRLGRNAIDVATTVAKLAEMGVRVHCLALGGVDLTSPAGRMTMGVINSVAQFERDLLIERTQSGLKRAAAAGEVFGRPPTLTEAQRAAVQEQIAAGASVSALAKRYGTSRQTVMRAKDARPSTGRSMPGGSITLGQVAEHTAVLVIACSRCDKAGQYR
jgi:putative DNA-invertase from lambdoid prophage Rac